MAGTLEKYKPPHKPASAHDLEIFETVKETLAQAEALRQDFPQREARLRSAADLFLDASARADELFGSLDEKRRSADRAAESAQNARQSAEALLTDLSDGRAAVLRAAQASLSVQADTEALRQDHHRLTAELSAARLGLQSLLDEAQATRETLRASRPLAASSAAPADFPTPEAYTAVPTMYPAGPTVLGFLYGLITDASTGAVQKTGDTMTGALSIDLSASSGPVGTFNATADTKSGQFGWIMNKAKALNTNPHGYLWQVGGVPTWGIGQDYDTNNSDNGGTGNSDFITCFDETANANVGADIMRFSPAEKDTIGNPKSCKMNYGGLGTGTPRTNTHVWTVDAGTGLGGLSLTINSQNARDHLTFVQAFSTSKRTVVNFAGLWKMGSDIGGANTTEFVLRDNTNSLNRLYVENTSALAAKMGLNTTGPIASFHSATFNDASLYDVAQTPFAAGFSTLTNRAIQFQQILDASQATNFMWLMGTLGAGSTRATPVTTSVGPVCHGIESTNTVMSLISAPTGTNQTISRVVGIGSNALAFFDTAPVAKQVGASAAGIASITDAAAKAAITAIQDALAAYALLTAPA